MRLFVVLISLWTSLLGGLPVSSEKSHYEKGRFTQQADHSLWDELLKRHVNPDGNVVYSKFKDDLPELDKYLASLAGNPPGTEASQNEKLAYYINLYNAATVKLILSHYPLRSIKDLKNPWSEKWISVNGQKLSLGHIEHKILRKMGEPRIHFAINCASYSCPKLLNEAYTATDLERQLQKVTEEFIRDTTRNKISPDQLELSEIFKWYKKDFTTENSLIEYLNANGAEGISPQAKITYLKYDWSLNEAKKFSAY